jgi:hypothetical protein
VVDLLVRIQHHPGRAELLDRLLPRLEGLRVEVVEDPDPGNRRPSPWRTYRECLSREWEGTHLLIIQDDAIPSPGFPLAAPRALDAQPESIVAFFLAQMPARTVRLAQQARRDRQHWTAIHPYDFVPVVATAYPRDEVARILRWASVNVARSQVGDDGIIGRYVRQHKGTALVTVPSIVEHPDDVPSTLRHRSPRHMKRTASVFDPDLDASTIVWA